MANTTPLSDSFTVFLYDFKLQNPFKMYPAFSAGSKGIWQKSKLKPDESFLFSHVRDFFTANSDTDELDENHFVIYELKRDSLSPEEKSKLSLITNLFSKTHILESGGKENSKIQFTILNDSSILSPKLFICPLTSIAILTFCFKLSDSNNTLENLVNLNFRSRVYSSGQNVWFSTPGNAHPQAAAREQKTQEEIKFFTNEEEPSQFSTSGIHSWKLSSFIHFCLQDLDAESLEEISPSRIQAFTYAQTERKMNKEETKQAIFLLRRMYNFNYLAPDFEPSEDAETWQPFEQIHFGASVEGVAVLVNEDKDKLPEFLKNYASVIKQRSLWTYIIAYHQRLAMIVEAKEVAALYKKNQSPSLADLSVVVKKITRVQLKCMFNEISHFTQQNDFYYLCCKNLRLPSLFQEVKEELTELNNSLEVEWHKSEELARKRDAEQDKKRDRNFSTLMGMLMIPQIWFAMIIIELEGWHHFLVEHENQIYWVTGILWIGIFAVGIKIYVLDKFRKTKERLS